MCDSARVPMVRQRAVHSAQTGEGGHGPLAGHGHERVGEDCQVLIGSSSESQILVRSSSGRFSSNAKAMPVNSGSVEDAAPTTATLRAGSRSRIETKAHAPMVLKGAVRGHDDTGASVCPSRGAVCRLATACRFTTTRIRVVVIHTVCCERSEKPYRLSPEGAPTPHHLHVPHSRGAARREIQRYGDTEIRRYGASDRERGQ
jgi:hypothetical protein